MAFFLVNFVLYLVYIMKVNVKKNGDFVYITNKEQKEFNLIYKYSENLFQANPIGSVSRNTYYKQFKLFLRAIKKLK